MYCHLFLLLSEFLTFSILRYFSHQRCFFGCIFLVCLFLLFSTREAGVGREGSRIAQKAKQRFEIEIVQIYGLADPLRLKESRKDWSFGGVGFFQRFGGYFCLLENAHLFQKRWLLQKMVNYHFFLCFLGVRHIT